MDLALLDLHDAVTSSHLSRRGMNRELKVCNSIDGTTQQIINLYGKYCAQ